MKFTQETLPPLPAEDALALYAELFVQFAAIREKLYSSDEQERKTAEEAREALKVQAVEKFRELYKNMGIDLKKFFQKGDSNPIVELIG